VAAVALTIAASAARSDGVASPHARASAPAPARVQPSKVCAHGVV